MTRAEHLQWAKDRALAFLAPPEIVKTEVVHRDQGPIYSTRDGHEHQRWPPPVTSKQIADACASFLSDLTKHPEIDPTAASMVYAMEVWSGGLNTADKVRHFINGTN
jgi:hypothetical protein